MKLSAFHFALLTFLCAGCVTPPQNADVVVAAHAPIVTTGTQAHAVCIGLTSVDPAAYQGWNGDCPGCDQDAKAMASLCQTAGAQTTLLLNSQATQAAVERAIKAAAASLTRGDLLIVTYSGHGGQVPDLNGDEADGQDETICLYDGQMVDDHIMELLLKLPPGLRVLLIADACHSEGNFRAFMRKATKAVTFGKYGHRQIKPLIGHKIVGRVSDPAKIWNGPLIEFAGCKEDAYSYGGETGGKWTLALCATCGFAPTTRAWFDSAQKLMDSRQQPQWVEFGAVIDAFRFAPPLK